MIPSKSLHRKHNRFPPARTMHGRPRRTMCTVVPGLRPISSSRRTCSAHPTRRAIRAVCPAESWSRGISSSACVVSIKAGKDTKKCERTRLLLNMRLNLSRSTDILSAFCVLRKDGFSESRVLPPTRGPPRPEIWLSTARSSETRSAVPSLAVPAISRPGLSVNSRSTNRPFTSRPRTWAEPKAAAPTTRPGSPAPPGIPSAHLRSAGTAAADFTHGYVPHPLSFNRTGPSSGNRPCQPSGGPKDPQCVVGGLPHSIFDTSRGRSVRLPEHGHRAYDRSAHHATLISSGSPRQTPERRGTRRCGS